MSSVDARALAETFGGADPARPLEPDLLPAVPALPAGADPSEVDVVLADGADQGPRILALLQEHLGTQPEWTVERGRGFTWWPGRLALTVRVGDPVVLHGLSAVRVTTTTTLLRDVPATREIVEHIVRPQRPGRDRRARDGPGGADGRPSPRTIWCHAGDAWLDPLVYSVSGLQAAIAESSVDALQAEIGGAIAATDHPASGSRAEHDELVELGRGVRGGGRPVTPFTEGDLGRSSQPARAPPVRVHGADAVTAEVPASSGDGLMADGAPRSAPAPSRCGPQRPGRSGPGPRGRMARGDARRRDAGPGRAHARRRGRRGSRRGGRRRHRGRARASPAPPCSDIVGTATPRRRGARDAPPTAVGAVGRRRRRARLAPEPARADRREARPFVGAWTAEGDAPFFVTGFPVPLAWPGIGDRLAILSTFAAWMQERAAWATPVALDGPEGAA